MERRKFEPEEARREALLQAANKGTDLTAALAACAYCGPYGQYLGVLYKSLTKEYGKEPYQLKSFEQFWTGGLERAVRALVGAEYTREIEETLRLRAEGQFSTNMFRRSFHSRDWGYYATSSIELLSRLIAAYCYRESVEEMLYGANDSVPGYNYRLALQIRKNNRSVIDAVRETILGDDPMLRLSRSIIEAVIISGSDALLDDLLKLLDAARLQEGLRQQILESADIGSTETLKRILKRCLDKDMFRYSSTVRAFDTWAGLGYGDEKPKMGKQCAEYAYACLTDEAVRIECLNSANNQQAYFALWATGCYEMGDTVDMTQKLLRDEKPYRRVLGWLFVSNADSSKYEMYCAKQFLHERDEEVLAWVVSCLPVTDRLAGYYYGASAEYNNEPQKNELFPADKTERRKLFYELKEVARFIGNRSRTFTGNPFDFISITLDNTQVIGCMMSAAGYDMDGELIDELLDLRELMNVEQRTALIVDFVRPETEARHRAFLREALNDRSLTVREAAVRRLAACTLLRDDLDALADSLRSKSSSLRKAVIAVLRSQSAAELEPVIREMLASDEEYQNQAAAELLLELREERPQIMDAFAGQLAQLRQKKLSTQTEILLDRLGETKHEQECSEQNGYGLYDPTVTAALAESVAPIGAQKTGVFSRLLGKKEQGELLTAKQIRSMLPSWEEFDAVLERMNQVFERHKDYEYEINTWDGRRKILFGDARRDLELPAEYGLRSITDEDARIEMVPFYGEFLEAMGPYAADAGRWTALGYIAETNTLYTPWLGSNMDIAPWFKPYERMQLAPDYRDKGYKKYDSRYGQLLSFIGIAWQNLDRHEVFAACMQLYRSMVAILGEENLGRAYAQAKTGGGYVIYGRDDKWQAVNHVMLRCSRQMIGRLTLSPEDYSTWFLQEYRLEKRTGVWADFGLRMENYFRACEEKIAPRDALMEHLILANDWIPGNIMGLTNPKRWPKSRALVEKYPWAGEVARELVERILLVEEKRGELPTPLTGCAWNIERFEGAEHFCNLLAALGKESFFRGYAYSRDTTKKAVLSQLLKCCYPAPDDTPERLAALIKRTDISDRRLAEAVMYAPQWAGFAEKILGWEGLKCAVWFFHAHINETFSAEKETEVAIYSPISPKQFNDGAFDRDWFFRAYEQLGEKRFQILYKSAKYITAGSNLHRRSQLYTDAVLGRLDAQELRQEIEEKRNQEKLRCYPLIPIADGDRQEALRRYEFIQKFLKESKQFGAQRRESEKKACATAMENLAITTGLMDVNRLTWQMESEKMDEIAPYLKAVEVEGVSLRLAVRDDGDAEVLMEKNGKPLKSAPKTLAKNETFLTLKAKAKELKEQKRRAKESFERAMTESTRFGGEELANILGNPVLAPLVSRLVWTDEEDLGFLRAEGGRLILTALRGEEKPLAGGQLRIAHPYDLRKAGEWAGYMHLLYERRTVQPFKQVFREYYPITQDERQEGLVSRRYEGYQVQPKKSIALLRSRGWTVDYEEGLQKVCYKENLIVRIYAMADWFSPADIEAPTLEVIRFFDRSTYEPVELEKVPPIVFSETMRDLDLVVSVAHVGGVDPEASHSTVEMRTAIAAELTKLLKLQNVSWIGSHAKIQGKLANYSVHMGSGIVHAEGRGMLAILPVHSQARGRIFLPFADDDPKTAEIMSKIILLAEDNKIKDPAILDQLCS